MKEPQYEDFQIPGHNVTIPIMLLHGKKYLQVAQRLVWFNLEKQDWSIDTEIENEWSLGNDGSILLVRFKCTIKDPHGRVMRVARKTKVVESEKDYESCETGAVGRALSLLGYGTAYDRDMDEGDVVDAPQPATPKETRYNNSQPTQDKRKAKMEETSHIYAPKPVTGHPFSEHTASDGVFTDKTFKQIFEIDSATGFNWTQKLNKQNNEGGKLQPWKIDYLVYANDCGLSLE